MSSDDLLKRNKALNKKIEENPVGARLRRLDWMVKILAISVALDILLSIAVAVLGWYDYNTSQRADSASKKAQIASSQTRINCLASNQARTQSLQLWDFVLSFPPPANETPAARKQRLASTKKFKAYIKKVFAPRDCSATSLAKQPVSPPPTAVPTPPASPSRTRSMGKPDQPQVTVTVVVSPRQTPEPSTSPAPEPSSHSPPPSQRPSPTPQPSPSKTCIIGPPLCLPPIGPPWRHRPSAPSTSTITATADVITTTQIESLVSALRPSTEVVWDTQLLLSPTPLPLDRLLAPWMYPTRVVISIQSSSWAIQVAIPLTRGT